MSTQYSFSIPSDKNRFNLVLKIAKLGFWDFEPNAEVLNWSARAKSFFGLSAGTEMTYTRFLSSLHPDDRERTHAAIQNALKAEVGGYRVEFRTIGIEDGLERTILAEGIVEFDHNQRASRIIGVSSDLTDQRLREKQLTIAKQEAECANKAKSEFLANMSHEIRTPLGAILGFSELASDPMYDDKERFDFIHKIRTNGNLLSKLINQILDLSQAEAKRVEIEPRKFSFASALLETLSSLSLQASQKGVEIRLRSNGKVPRLIETDLLRFKQILVNVIGNAVKFTEKGHVEVTAEIASPLVKGKRITVAISVRDTGIGISLEKRRRLFERFSQGDSSITRKYGGTGLGLALSKELALALGGDLLLAESTEGQGSTFVFIFPDSTYDEQLELVSLDGAEEIEVEAVKPAKSAVPLEGVKVLVVDDSEDNQLMLGRILQSAGAQVEKALNGVEAVEIALKGDFDVILMDLQMPILDGVSATKRLREHGFKKPILALTAHALASDREKTLDQGFDDHLTKPIKLEYLIAQVAEHANQSTACVALSRTLGSPGTASAAHPRQQDHE